MRTLTLSLTIIALCIWTLPAYAQQEAENSADKEESIVQMTMQSQIKNTASVPQLPLSIVQRLNDQSALTNLEVETNERETQISARFSFGSLEAFGQWYKSTPTQEIIQMLNEDQNRVRLAVQIAKEGRR